MKAIRDIFYERSKELASVEVYQMLQIYWFNTKIDRYKLTMNRHLHDICRKKN